MQLRDKWDLRVFTTNSAGAQPARAGKGIEGMILIQRKSK
jgi:hypothetical protein